MASNRGSDFVNVAGSISGTNITGTLFSNGISLSVAAPTVQTAFVFSNSNGVSFGTNGSTVTASVQTNYQSTGNYLTTAALSNHSHNFATTTTNGSLIVVGTTNSNGATIGVPAFLTTAQSPGAYLTTARASNDAIGLNTALTGNGVAWTVNSSGLSLNVPAFLTTAMQSNAATISNIRVSAGTTSNLLSAITFNNANGITFGLNASTLTASHNGLTTAALSDHSHGNPTLALTNISGTTASNSAGLTLSLSVAAPGAGGGIANAAGTQTATSGTVVFSNANGITFGMSNSSVITASYNSTQFQTTGNYLTTAMQTGSQSQLWIMGNSSATVGGTNISGTMFSNGLSLSAAAPGGGGAINVSAGTTSNNLQTVVFSNSNGVSFGLNGSTVTASVNAGGGAANTFYSTVIGKENAWAISSSSLGQNSLYIQPHHFQNNVSAIAVKVPVMITNSSIGSSSGANGYTARFGIYTTNATNSTVLSLHYSTSYTMYASNSSNASRAYSVITGIGNSTSYNTVSSSSAGLNLSSNIHGPREFILPISSLLSPGAYWFAWNQSSGLTGTSNSVLAISHIIHSSQTQAGFHVATSATSVGGIAKNIGLGTYSTTTGALPNGISLTQINKAATQPVFYIVNATS
jgi:hypothetical protein